MKTVQFSFFSEKSRWVSLSLCSIIKGLAKGPSFLYKSVRFMTESPELVRISLNLHEEVACVQGIIFSGQCPHELNFDHLVFIGDLPCLDLTTAPSHLTALLYEIAESEQEESKLEHLLAEGQNHRLGLFSEPGKEFGMLYIIAHCDDRNGLGQHFNGAKFGMFLYHYKEVLGQNIKNYISFIRVMKISKSNFIKKTQDKFKELEEKKEEKKHYEEMADYLSKRSGRLKEELETAKLAIQQLNYQLEKKQSQLKERQEQSLECVICRSALKDVVFLPCGHIVVCKNCLIETMNVIPNTVINKKNNPIKCPLCKNPVKESKEVHL
jgi:rubrerythrin